MAHLAACVDERGLYISKGVKVHVCPAYVRCSGAWSWPGDMEWREAQQPGHSRWHVPVPLGDVSRNQQGTCGTATQIVLQRMLTVTWM